MNKFKYYFLVVVTTLSLFSCSKDTPVETVAPREYSVQYTTDLATIEEYLKTTYITVTNHAGFLDDQDVSFTKIPSGGTQPSIWSYLNSSSFPKLLTRDVNLHGITYKVYYLVLREGTGDKPTNVDGVLASYRGDYLTQVAATTTTPAALTATQFEESKYPQSFFGLTNTIVGWSEIFPQFKKGTYTANVDGTISYANFGAGVMFLPSGLAYFASGSGVIPSYSPLVFSFKLYEIQRSDLDGDGIPSYLEDLNGDGYMYDFRNTTTYPVTPTTNADDTDGDGTPNFYDVDDDGDNYTTKLEIKNTTTGLAYPFASIPDCSGNTTNPARVKKHLDKNCH
ncbi:MAG: hypothetical protein RLZZ44_265 [Bacteroidota bacterium]|jgi:hypothetical protein